MSPSQEVIAFIAVSSLRHRNVGPNALVLCPFCGFENSETSVNQKMESENRKIRFSEFVPGFEKSCLPDL